MKIRNFLEGLQHGDIQIVIVPGVGHMMMVDNPSLFSQTLASVLQ
jgi:pimeloyl-ACP methyl ester carboxylesterase